MTVEPRDLAAHLVPEITEGRLARQWATLEGKLPRSSAGPGFRGAALTVSALVVAAWIWWTPAQRPVSGAVVESSDTPIAVQLRDGSSLELAAQTRLRVLRDQKTAVELELAEGRASFDVTHVDDRSFTVLAGSVAVHVIGTKFDVIKVVRPEGTEVQVSVERGIVEVERTDRGDQRRLTVGERWSVWIPAEPIAQPLEAAGDDDAYDAPRRTTRRRRSRTHVAHRVTAAAGRAQSESSPKADDDLDDRDDKPDEARDVFARATVARRAGMMAEAASAYADVLARFPSDPRAAIAAFELGRIRMDALGDPRGAAQAFNVALRLPNTANREDALARLAISYKAVGDLSACRKARQRYLSEYPVGVHVAALTALCAQERAEP